MRVAGLLAGGAAHELNNIFALLLMQVDLLAAMVESPEAQEIARDLRDGVERGIGVNRSLLRQAHVSFRERLPVNPKFLVTGIQKGADDLLGPDTSLVTQYPEQLPDVEIEPLELLGALLFLCRSAVQAAADDGLVLRVEAPEDAEAEKASVLVTVSARGWQPTKRNADVQELEALGRRLAGQGVELVLGNGSAGLRLPVSRPRIET